MFKTKTAAREFVSWQLLCADEGRVDASEEPWLRALLAAHYDQRMRELLTHASHFVKMKTPPPVRPLHRWCFGVVSDRGDDELAWISQSAFTYTENELLGGNTDSDGMRLRAVSLALRCETQKQCHAFKLAAFASTELVRCAETREMLTWQQAEVGYANDAPGQTFFELRQRYEAHLLASRGIREPAARAFLSKLGTRADEAGQRWLADAKEADEWRAWHAQHATLRIICTDAYRRALCRALAAASVTHGPDGGQAHHAQQLYTSVQH